MKYLVYQKAGVIQAEPHRLLNYFKVKTKLEFLALGSIYAVILVCSELTPLPPHTFLHSETDEQLLPPAHLSLFLR